MITVSCASVTRARADVHKLDAQVRRSQAGTFRNSWLIQLSNDFWFFVNLMNVTRRLAGEGPARQT